MGKGFRVLRLGFAASEAERRRWGRRSTRALFGPFFFVPACEWNRFIFWVRLNRWKECLQSQSHKSVAHLTNRQIFAFSNSILAGWSSDLHVLVAEIKIIIKSAVQA
jgi:hypothetical protein